MLSDLALPEDFDLELLLGRLATHRGRPLRLLPLLPGLRDEPSGMWVPLPSEDVIFAESSVSGWYRDHVVLHEVGHMLWDHAGLMRDVTTWLSRYGVTGTPARVALRCSVSAVEQEREAEMIALLLESRISRRTSASSAPASADTPMEVAAVLHRLATAMGSQAGRD